MKTRSKPKNRYLQVLGWAFLFFFILGIQKSKAIEITSTESPNCLVNLVVGTPMAPLGLTSDVPGVDWTVESITDVSLLIDIGLTLDPATGTLTGTPTLSGNYDVGISVADAGNPLDFDVATIRICITRPPVDIMLVLDRSGSMSQPVTGLSLNKWEVMKESVRIFLQEFDDFSEAGDNVGVVYFDDSRGDYEESGSPGLHPFADETAIMTDYDNFPPSGWTCLGGGILAGYEALTGNPLSHIILMTDGIQNRDPSYDQISQVVQDHGTFTDGTGFPGTSLDMASPPNQFKIHTIAIGDNAVTGMVQEIAEANSNNDLDGEHLVLNSMSNLIPDLNAFFDEAFVAALADFSPAIVNNRTVSLAGGEFGTNTSFYVNNTADRVIIKVVGDPRQLEGLRMNVNKGSVSFPNDIQYNRTSIIFSADEAMLAGRGVQPGGQWLVNLSGRRGEVNVSCLVNDELINYDASIGGIDSEPGDPLNLRFEIDILGNPVTNLTEARALVLKPGQDINDLFAKANSNVDPPGEWPTEPGVNPGQDKYDKLIALDQSFINALIPVENIINLNNKGDGTYTATFNDTEESGVYTVYFYARGNTPGQGEFERFRLMTKTIDFGTASDENSSFTVTQVDDDVTKLILIPRNKFGYLIGPNRLNQITLTVDGDRLELTDKLDGSYEATVPSFGFFNTNPDVQVGIKGNWFYDGAYADIEGANLSIFDLYRPWIIIVVLLILIIIWLARRKKQP